MTPPILNVAVSDVEREQTVSRQWELTVGWLAGALADTEARPTELPGRLTAELFVNGKQIVVRGRIAARVELPCARTLEPAIYDLQPELFLILQRGSAVQASPRRAEGATQSASRRNRASQRKTEEEEEAALGEEDAAFDTFSGDVIHLDEFVREQLLLELPMFPLRSDLRSTDSAAIPPPPRDSASSGTVDPRLLPLKALADKMKTGKS